MNPSLLSVAGITTVISLVFTVVVQYIPVVNVKWGGLPKETKKFIVLAGYFVFGAAVAWGGCIPAIAKLFPQLLCVEPATFYEYAFGVLIAVGAGQGVFGLSPEVEAVKEAKAIRDEEFEYETPV